ncbi:uncharacterized protein LOC142616260 [Castanea sativa]|uniref:uncharacterized protein LOC142616260 n=1 Tax=Castanea sativa TaxID=21020 RepID=UPI003F652DE8
MRKMGFSSRWVDLIMACVGSASYQVLVNGVTRGNIRPTRGIRQGDPLSSYLFLICSEALNQQLQHAARFGMIRGFSLYRNGPRISHLFFDDDTLLFCHASRGDLEVILQLLQLWLLRDEPAKVISPSNNVTVKWAVSMLMDPGGAGWNEHLVDAMFLPFEAQLIKGIPICITSQANCVLWIKCRTGSCSIRSGYQLLCEAKAAGAPLGSTVEGVKKFWKSIWHLKVPNKVKVFLWRACFSALPTKAGLHKRKIVDDNLCDQCLWMITSVIVFEMFGKTYLQ